MSAHIRSPRVRSMAPAAVLAAGLLWTVSTCVAETHVIRVRANDAGGAAAPDTVATLGQAVAAATELRRRHGTPVDIRIELLPDVHRLDEAVRIGPELSGTAERPLVITGSGAKRPVIRGSVAIARSTGPLRPSLAVLVPAAARAHVEVYKLPARLSAVDRIDVARPPPGPAIAPFEVFGNDIPLQPARWPNAGWARIASVDGGHRFALAEAAERSAAWNAEPDAWVGGYFNWQWKYETRPLLRAADRHLEVATAPPLFDGIKAGGRVMINHALSELDASGEWYRDRTENQLIVWPPAPGAILEVSLAQSLLAIEGANHVRIRRLAFQHARGDALTIKRARDVVIEDCEITAVAGRAVAIDEATRSGVNRATISDTGTGGVALNGGQRETLSAGGNFVTHSRIERFSRLAMTYAPAITLNGVGNRAEANFIADAPHTAILFQGNDHLIARNEITRVMTDSSDGGAIYSGRDWTARGTRITGNFLHDIRPPTGLEAKGIYLDDMASGIRIDHNLFLRVDQAVFIGGGSDNAIIGNVFVGPGPAIHIDSRGRSEHTAQITDPASEYRRAFAAMPVASALWRARYPTLARMLDAPLGLAKGNVVRGNVFDQAQPFEILGDVDRSQQTLQPNATVNDPAVVAAARKAESRHEILAALAPYLDETTRKSLSSAWATPTRSGPQPRPGR